MFVYTKRQRQHCNNSAMTLAILFSLKTMGSLQNGVATHFQLTPLFTTDSLASLQSCCSIDADAWCKWALKLKGPNVRQKLMTFLLVVEPVRVRRCGRGGSGCQTPAPSGCRRQGRDYSAGSRLLQPQG